MLKIFNSKWYNSILISLLISILSFFGFSIPNKYIFYLCCYIPFVFFFATIFFGIIRISKKEYVRGILQSSFAFILGIVVFGFFSFFLMFYPNDFYANNLEIPKNIKFEKPLEIIYENDKPEIIVTKEDVILYDYFQPGIYKYDIFLRRIEKGNVYLKIFEITNNELLSEKEIKEKSQIEVGNQTDELKRFELQGDFKIYEGDWGDFYGSRVEVWFKPDDINKPERKLVTKNYVVQGWMR